MLGAGLGTHGRRKSSESANNATVATVGPFITDQLGNQWTITAGAQVAFNGTPVAPTSGVIELAYVNHVVWQHNTANNWYSFVVNSGVPSDTGVGPTTSPLPARVAGTPTVAVGSPTSNSLALTVTISAGGTPATYAITRSTTSGGTYSAISGSPFTYSASPQTITDSGLSGSQAYFYHVTATNATGTSGVASGNATTASSAPAIVTANGTTSITSYNFQQSFGACAHLDQGGTYANTTNVIAAMNYLGISHYRCDGTPSLSGGISAAWIAMANAGLSACVLPMGGGGTFTTTNVTNAVNGIVAFNAAHPNGIAAVEPTNEINNQQVNYNNGSGSLSGIAGADSLQKDMYNAIKAQLPNMAVYYYSSYMNLAGPYKDPRVAPLMCDYDNAHPYPESGLQPRSYMDPSWFYALGANEPSGAKGPGVYTEAGYPLTGGIQGDVNVWISDAVRAKYVLNMMMDCVNFGITRLYWYQLLDMSNDTAYGFYNTSNVATASANSVHNMMTIIKDTGGSAATYNPTPITFSTTNLPSLGFTYLIQRSDGHNFIVVWREPVIWNTSTHAAIVVGATNVTVTFGGVSYANVNTYDPLVNATATVKTPGTSVVISLVDHPILIEVW